MKIRFEIPAQLERIELSEKIKARNDWQECEMYKYEQSLLNIQYLQTEYGDVVSILKLIQAYYVQLYGSMTNDRDSDNPEYTCISMAKRRLKKCAVACMKSVLLHNSMESEEVYIHLCAVVSADTCNEICTVSMIFLCNEKIEEYEKCFMQLLESAGTER